MTEKQRIKRLSTRWLIPFKISVYLMYTTLMLLLIVPIIQRSAWVSAFVNLGIYGYLLYMLLRMSARLKHVEFDDDYLYVVLRKNDVMIPLENIKSVEIKTMGGVYKVTLMYEDIIGKDFYFKPSLLYPFNHQSKDELVNLLRSKIELAKRKKQSFPANALQS